MEHLFIYMVLALACFLSYKVCRLKSREKKLREEMTGLKVELIKKQGMLEEMKSDSLPDGEDTASYTETFLQRKLMGARRQTYIHDSLYVVLAKVLPIIAPEMSVPTFVNSVLSNHLEKNKDIINAMYHEEVAKRMIEWKN